MDCGQPSACKNHWNVKHFLSRAQKAYSNGMHIRERSGSFFAHAQMGAGSITVFPFSWRMGCDSIAIRVPAGKFLLGELAP